MQRDVTIHPYLSLTNDARLSAGLDALFFEASNTKSFASDAERAAFRARWLGRYLEHDPQFAFVALGSDGAVAGYIVGSVDDPARAARFSDIAYFQTFKDLTRSYPAQLHVNLAPAFRGERIGEQLVTTFVEAVHRAGAPGVHVVTSRASRNVSFYNRLGFIERGASGEGTKEIVFLARDLNAVGAW